MLHRLEARHGRPVVSRAMAFMVASATGLSDLEMEDLLSMDDVVLDHLFSHYHPPLRRAPSIVWLKVPTPLLSFSCPCSLGAGGFGCHSDQSTEHTRRGIIIHVHRDLVLTTVA